ncbi:acyl-CoA dehydrogenase family protein [Streptomyces monticola]|uniref:Acyl-CoA dehydrogenase family protein n=1 Tax=Streptomyces monticola TaxID=2666263 RepID=A0ABW2JXZ0_9ACTN
MTTTNGTTSPSTGTGTGTAQKRTDPGAVEGDFYAVKDLLDPEERQILDRVRAFLDAEVRPLANEQWADATTPVHLAAGLADLGITGSAYHGYGCPGFSNLLAGLLTMEMGRVDASFATFFGVHSGLALGSVMLTGSDEQRRRWLPDLLAWRRIGAFALTEPDVGSGAAGGLTTTARREGDTWILDGRKKWIGNGTFADLIVVWARDVADGQVKGFVVDKSNHGDDRVPGFTATKIEGKVSLRGVQNALIELDGVRVPEADRLQNAHTFKDVARVLKTTRGGVAWNALGCSIGAYEAARRYAVEREQFGRPIARFQIVQDNLARMLANITASQGLLVRMAQLQDEHRLSDPQASVAKMFCTTAARETVQLAREVFGGNGILVDHDIARFWADAEALYSYEGTRDMQALIVGRAATGHSAFV